MKRWVLILVGFSFLLPLTCGDSESPRNMRLTIESTGSASIDTLGFKPSLRVEEADLPNQKPDKLEDLTHFKFVSWNSDIGSRNYNKEENKELEIQFEVEGGLRTGSLPLLSCTVVNHEVGVPNAAFEEGVIVGCSGTLDAVVEIYKGSRGSGSFITLQTGEATATLNLELDRGVIWVLSLDLGLELGYRDPSWEPSGDDGGARSSGGCGGGGGGDDDDWDD